MKAKQSEPLTKCIQSSIESKLEFQFILLCIDWMRIYTQQSDLSKAEFTSKGRVQIRSFYWAHTLQTYPKAIGLEKKKKKRERSKARLPLYVNFTWDLWFVLVKICQVFETIRYIWSKVLNLRVPMMKGESIINHLHLDTSLHDFPTRNFGS